MMVTGDFYVLTLGKRYVRDHKYLMVGQSLQHAERFKNFARVHAAKRKMQSSADRLKKPLRAWHIIIQEVLGAETRGP